MGEHHSDEQLVEWAKTLINQLSRHGLCPHCQMRMLGAAIVEALGDLEPTARIDAVTKHVEGLDAAILDPLAVNLVTARLRQRIH